MTLCLKALKPNIPKFYTRLVPLIYNIRSRRSPMAVTENLQCIFALYVVIFPGTRAANRVPGIKPGNWYPDSGIFPQRRRL